MRTLNQYLSYIFYESNSNNYNKNVKFKIINWNSDSDKFKAVINGEIRTFKFYGNEDHEEIIRMINSYYFKSKSVNKTIQYIENRFAKLLPVENKNKFAKLTGKFVKCPECEQMMQISGNRPGTICPNCNSGELEPM